MTKEKQQRQKNVDDVILVNCDIIVFLPIHATLSVKRMLSLTVSLYLTKPENRIKKNSNTALSLLLWVKVLLLTKNTDFFARKKSRTSAKLRDSSYLNKTAYHIHKVEKVQLENFNKFCFRLIRKLVETSCLGNSEKFLIDDAQKIEKTVRSFSYRTGKCLIGEF